MHVLLRHAMKCVVVVMLAGVARAGTLTMSPGESLTSKASQLKPGDTLELQDGTYGMVHLDCRTNARNGTAQRPITLKAHNERRAWLKGDGSTIPFKIYACAYWTIEGLRISSADNPNVQTPGSDASIFSADDSAGGTSSHMVIRRTLFHTGNRYANGAAVILGNESLFEENEMYTWHRNGLGLGNNNEARRNYLNSHRTPDLPGATGCAQPHVPGTPRCSGSGGGGILLYPGAGNLIENNISVDTNTGAEIQSAYGNASKNTFLGNIALNTDYGFLGAARIENDGGAQMYPDTMVKDQVVIGPRRVGLYARSPKNLLIDKATILVSGSPSTVVGGAIFGRGSSGAIGDGSPSFAVSGLLVSGTGSGWAGGIVVDTSIFPSWQVSTSNAYSNPPCSPAMSGVQSTDPQLGSCKVWIPDSSPMKALGIGANVLYRYEQGVLTKEGLWGLDGSFPCGAKVAGVNDIPGQSCFDVHLQLNVNTNGCPFPQGYTPGGGDSAKHPAPKRLRVVPTP